MLFKINKEFKLSHMIKANELWIGNYILLNGKPIKVTAEEIFDIRHSEEIGGSNEMYQPIYLTKEVLEKCGFEQSDFMGVKTGVYKKNGLKVGLSEDDIIYEQLTAVFNEQEIVAKVKHLHQLQNWFYALTGEGLEYKP